MEFSVRSVYWYRFANDPLRNLPSPSDCSILQSMWKKIWSSLFPPKVSVWLWCALKNELPTKMNLIRRRIPIDMWCSFCINQVDSLEHYLFSCMFTPLLWSQVCPRAAFSSYNGSFATRWTSLYQSGNYKDLVDESSFWHFLWNCRNMFLFKGQNLHPQTLIRRWKNINDQLPVDNLIKVYPINTIPRKQGSKIQMMFISRVIFSIDQSYFVQVGGLLVSRSSILLRWSLDVPAL